jgi:hypothetical protein
MMIRTLVQSVALAALVMLPASARAGGGWCDVTEVYAFSNRVHVKCGAGPNYYAVPTSNSGEAARFTTMASLALGGQLWIDFDFADLSGQSFGCEPRNCRRALGFALR